MSKNSVIYAKKKFILMIKNIRNHCHYTRKYRAGAHDIWNLRYKTPKEIPVVLNSGYTYDYYFTIKELAEEFQGKFKCLRENTEKYITFFSTK